MSFALCASAIAILGTGNAVAAPQFNNDNNKPAIAMGHSTGAQGQDDRRGRAAHYRPGHRDQHSGIVAVSMSGIAVGYSDGYWDNAHTWHKWRRPADYNAYSHKSGSHFHNWRHDRDGSDGWKH